MTSHLGLLIVFACFVSTVFATLMRDTINEQVRFGLRMFAGFVAAALAMGWLMYPFPL
jgi:prepilin signal peptidase PulO-like enzyme (type II secretory pathway)